MLDVYRIDEPGNIYRVVIMYIARCQLYAAVHAENTETGVQTGLSDEILKRSYR
jgi:hypothetical protein